MKKGLEGPTSRLSDQKKVSSEVQENSKKENSPKTENTSESKTLNFLLNNKAPASKAQHRTSSQQNAWLKNAHDHSVEPQCNEEWASEIGAQRNRGGKLCNEKENLSAAKELMNSQDRSEEYTPIFEEEDRYSAAVSATLESKVNTVEVGLPQNEM